MPDLVSNTEIAFMEGENHAAECHAEKSTCGALLACPYDSDEMIKAYTDGFNHYFHNVNMAICEQAHDEEITSENEEESGSCDIDCDDNGFTSYQYEK